MCVTLVHNFKAKVSSVYNVSPSWNDFAVCINDGLIKVKAIKVESHGADTHRGKPYANDGPSSEKNIIKLLDYGLLVPTKLQKQ